MDVWERVARRTPVRGFCYVRLLEERRGLRRAAMQGRDGWRKRDEEKVVDSQLPRFIFALPTHQNWNKQSQAPVRASASRAQKLTIFFFIRAAYRTKAADADAGYSWTRLVTKSPASSDDQFLSVPTPPCAQCSACCYTTHALDTPPAALSIVMYHLRGFRLCSAL